MKGSAPNSPDTGSQSDVVQNFHANFRIGSVELRMSSKPIPATIRRTSTAKRAVARRKPPSSLERRRRFDGGAVRALIGEDFGAGRAGPDGSSLHPGNRRLFEGDDFLRQGRVSEIRAVFLTVGEHPVHEIRDDLSLRLVLLVLVDEQPREG